jgi:hypothetical protein
MKIKKRESLSALLRNWLNINRTGKLASDQWLNLVTAPLYTIILLSIPLIAFFMIFRLRVLLRLGAVNRFVIPLFLVAVLVMFLVRARRYARLPVRHGTFYGSDQSTFAWSQLRRRVTVYTEKGEPIMFSGFASSPPHLEPDTPYLMYFLEEPNQRVLLSFAPAEHPDIERWQPTDQFYARQKRRTSAV